MPATSPVQAPSVLPSPDMRITTSVIPTVPKARKGKAPPDEFFTGEDPQVRLDDWLPGLVRTSRWNGWSAEEQLIQLAGHLKGRALQEWNLLDEDQASSYGDATQALREKLEPGNRVLAGQDFRHTMQGEAETVSDFIRHLEQVFQIAYGRDKMSLETREAILYGQMQEGLCMELLRGLVVSGATSYKELYTAAKNEERRVSKLKKKQNYLKQQTS